LLQSQFVAIEFNVHLCPIDLSTLKSEEHVVNEAQAERFLGSPDESGSTECGIGSAERVDDESEVGVSKEIVFSEDLVVEDEHFFELVEAVVVK
jgi:hypothetical protein